MHGFSRYRRIKYIQEDILFHQPTALEDILFHQLIIHHNIGVTLESDIDAIHEVGVLVVKDQEVILQAVHEVEALNVIILKVLGKIMIKTLKMQRVPVSSPVEHESLNLLHRNNSSHSRSCEYSFSSQCNNLYESHEIGSPSWYNKLPSRSYSRSHTSNSLINNNQLESPDSPRPFASPELSVSPEPTNGYKSVPHKQSKISDINPSDNGEGKLTNISLNLYNICILGLTSANNIDRQSSASTREESIQQNTPAADNHYLSNE
ncbi:11263_t:CDS:2, partial [Gigaspora margarita]